MKHLNGKAERPLFIVNGRDDKNVSFLNVLVLIRHPKNGRESLLYAGSNPREYLMIHHVCVE